MKKLFYFAVITLISLLSVPTVLAQYYPFMTNPQGMPVYIVPSNYISYTGSRSVFLCSELMKDFTKIPDVCYTNATLPLDHLTYEAGEKINVIGRVYTPTVGYGVVDPQVHFYFDGTYVGTAYGDANGNYHFAFNVPSYLYSGYHSLSINATLAGCVPGYTHERVYINAYEPVVPPAYTVSYTGNLVFNVKDCDTGNGISAYVVLSPGLYTRSSTTGAILFSGITVRTYDYYASASGYTSEYGNIVAAAGDTTTKEVCLKKIYPPAPLPPQTIVVPPAVDPPIPEFHLESSCTGSCGTETHTPALLYSISPIVVLLPLMGIALKLFVKYRKFKSPEQM